MGMNARHLPPLEAVLLKRLVIRSVQARVANRQQRRTNGVERLQAALNHALVGIQRRERVADRGSRINQRPLTRTLTPWLNNPVRHTDLRCPKVRATLSAWI